jgi:hypothetical protein
VIDPVRSDPRLCRDLRNRPQNYPQENPAESSRHEDERLPFKVGSVLRTARGPSNVHYVAVAGSPMFVLHGVNHIGVPEDRVPRLHERDRRERLYQQAVVLLANREARPG